MAVATSDRATRRWVSRPRRPILYGPFARFADWLAATRDARAGLPDPDLGDKVGSPRLEFLDRRARDAEELELLHYSRDTAASVHTLGSLSGVADGARERLADALAELDTMPEHPAEDDLAVRRAGEGRRGTDATVVRTRRMREHQAKRAPMVARVRQERERLASLTEQIAGAQAQADLRFQVAQTRARRIHEHAARRKAAYAARLLRKHPKGAQLNTVLDMGSLEPPSWVYGDPPQYPLARDLGALHGQK